MKSIDLRVRSYILYTKKPSPKAYKMCVYEDTRINASKVNEDGRIVTDNDGANGREEMVRYETVK